MNFVISFNKSINNSATYLVILVGFLFSHHTAAAGEGEDFWPAYNRSISAELFTLQQDYVEFDEQGLTQNGILDSESGAIPGMSAQMRWQGKDIPLWAQLRYQRNQGRTSYQGHLQSGTFLVPFNAKTGNTIHQTAVAVGIPFQIRGNAVQVIPYVELAQNRWRRNLLQYKERYRTQTVDIGILTQWRLSNRWTAEAAASAGRQTEGRIHVDAFQFASGFQSSGARQLKLGLAFHIDSRMEIGAHWAYTRIRHHATEIINGMQAPPAMTRQHALELRMGWHY
ncbi:MAG: hypothetical protein M9929_00880 [Burkholderiaceae bacterium]|nr:hypothetical protein [Burkholderiaceae bacterium]